MGTFQNQQSLPGQLVTATAQSCKRAEDTLALPFLILNTSQFGMLLWYPTLIPECVESWQFLLMFYGSDDRRKNSKFELMRFSFCGAGN